jgi:DNA processing protein
MRAKSVLPTGLWTLGNLDLLERPAIGICGSRDASPQALEWAYRFGQEAANHGLVVVSGYARGVDRQAHKGALDAQGGTIAVLPEGIEHFSVVKDLRGVADLASNFLAVSMFERGATWQVSRAMERNRLIVALSVGIFVIEAKETGGTISAAYECVRQGKYLWAISYGTRLPGREGNEKLLAGAAIPLKGTKDLRGALERAMKQPPASVKQLVMALTRDQH